MNIKAIVQQAARDRGYVVALITSAVILVAVAVLCSVEIRPNELQVPIRNTVFGITYTYREQWYSELAFAGFAVLVWGLNTLIAAKLFVIKDRRYGIGFQWLTGILLAICFFILLSVFRVISIVE
jgi:uncharacterized membrane protein (UPF0136 family)